MRVFILANTNTGLEEILAQLSKEDDTIICDLDTRAGLAAGVRAVAEGYKIDCTPADFYHSGATTHKDLMMGLDRDIQVIESRPDKVFILGESDVFRQLAFFALKLKIPVEVIVHEC
jgi:hypothetical protein